MAGRFAVSVFNSTNSEKCAALEAVASHRTLTIQQSRIIVKLGLNSVDKLGTIERPWGVADTAMVRRLAKARGWSVLAISAFLHRPESQVREALGR